LEELLSMEFDSDQREKWLRSMRLAHFAVRLSVQGQCLIPKDIALLLEELWDLERTENDAE